MPHTTILTREPATSTSPSLVFILPPSYSPTADHIVRLGYHTDTHNTTWHFLRIERPEGTPVELIALRGQPLSFHHREARSWERGSMTLPAEASAAAGGAAPGSVVGTWSVVPDDLGV